MPEKTLESPLDSKEIKSVNPKENQPWVFIGRIDAEAQTQYISHLMQSQLIGKHSEARKDWGQEEKEATSMSWLDDIINSMDLSLSKLQKMVIDTKAWRAVVNGIAKIWAWLSDWQQHNRL